MMPTLGPTKKRPVSDVAVATAMAAEMQQTTIEKMRQASLRALPRTRLSRQITPPLSPNRISTYIQESAAECREETPRPDLVERAMQDVQQSIKYAKIDPRDLMCEDGFFGFNRADSRMDDWVKQAANLSRHEMEMRKGTPSEEIPEHQQHYSCFQYALACSGIPLPEETMRDLQSECLFDAREVVDTLHSYCAPVEEPLEGDLVLFWANGRPSHLGIYRQGQVLSKEGDWSPFAYSRPLEDLGVDYGDEVTFLRTKEPLC